MALMPWLYLDSEGDLWLAYWDSLDLVRCRCLGTPQENLYAALPRSLHPHLDSLLSESPLAGESPQENRVEAETHYPFGDLRNMNL